MFIMLGAQLMGPLGEFNIACGSDYLARLQNPWLWPWAICGLYAVVCFLAPLEMTRGPKGWDVKYEVPR